jgi:biotin operon repressor
VPSSLIIPSLNHCHPDNINTLDTLKSNIITLLSNHRDPDSPNQPKALSKLKIIGILRESVSPNLDKSNLQTEILEKLQDLEAQGEIISDKNNRYYSIAHPSLLANSRQDIRGLLFRGDRAYLQLAHQVLNSRNQDRDGVQISFRSTRIDSIQKKLDPIGIRLLSAEDLIHRLPSPQKPPKYVLRCPTTLPDSSDGELFSYEPVPNTLQEDRWQPVIVTQVSTLAAPSILKLSKDRYYRNDRYFYWKGNKVYELDRDVAVLAMFDKDRETNSPLRVIWHTSEGKLDLGDIYLPLAYMSYLWQLSGEAEQNSRIRSVPAASRSLIEPAFQRLGCLLV